MLENYYDVAKADQFERLFGGLAIGRAPTPTHNRYFVLKWDFSVVAVYGDADAIVRSLHEYLNSRIQDFAVYYRDFLPTAIDLHPTNALVSFQSLLTAVRATPYRLYLLIDEYDNFANEIVMSAQAGGRGRYEALLHGEGALKTVFKAIKAASAGAGLDRVFITGVSPVVLSDLTSGYNVARSIAAHAVLHDLCGLTEPEIAVGALADRFGVTEMLREDQETNFIASLIYFLGVLTIGGLTPTGKLILTIPNLVVRRLYVEQTRDLLLPGGRAGDDGRQAAERFCQDGDLGPLCQFIEQRYFRVFDNRDYRWADELTVKTAFLTLLFNDMAYIMDSEPALERTHADLVMIVRPDMRQYQLLDLLLEFKFVTLPEARLTGEQARGLSVAELRALPVMQRKQAEARAKLQSYRRTLQARYGDPLRLRAYAVVALGFERLAWEEV